MNNANRIEAAARALASVEPGEEWPTNEALGGSLTGTRDDEYRAGIREDAKDALDAADYADGEQSIQRVRVDDEALDRMAKAIWASAPGRVTAYKDAEVQWRSRAVAALNALVDVKP